MRILLALALLPAGCSPRPRPRPFTTDGCSFFPDGTADKRKLWLHCCEDHDRSYWRGGTKPERLRADQALRACVAAVEQPKTAALMLTGTRAGGTPHLPTPFRWGYGWSWLRGYKALTDAEKKLLEDSYK